MALTDTAKVALADTFALYLKSHNFHWNIEGPNFAQYHDFLGDFYAEVFGAVDAIAEQIRTLDVYVPGSFLRYRELSTIEDETKVPTAINMLKKLRDDNKKVIASLTAAYKDAEKEDRPGFSNFLQSRIEAH